MSDAAAAQLALPLSLLAAALLTPAARWVAVRTEFYDRPVGYKAHAAATPYLGGLAVVVAFLLGWTAVGDAWGTLLPLTLAIVGLLIVGTIDDRVGLSVGTRFAVQIAAAGALWAGDLGWSVSDSGAVNLMVTIVWVVGIVNAFNLMDNQDGAAATVAAASAVGIAGLSLVQGETALAGLALAVAGACLGFLPFNLARPARIFLGDGGSMAIGLAIAGLIMADPGGSGQWTDLLAAAPLAGLPILDTALVVFSRYRRHAVILSGARDHTTHRLLSIVRTPQRVAFVLGVAQLLLCFLSIALYRASDEGVAVVGLFYLAMGATVIVLLDDPRWEPGEAARRQPGHEERSA